MKGFVFIDPGIPPFRCAFFDERANAFFGVTGQHVFDHHVRGEVIGLIGESGAGKSTLGLASMNYTRGGCRIASGSIVFDGLELFGAPEEELRKIRGVRISYVAQSAAAWPTDDERPYIIYCHHGMRSLQATQFLRGKGYANSFSLAGGIDAWSLQIDPEVPRY